MGDDTKAKGKFHTLIWPLLPLVLRAARVLCRREDESDDLAQDTMLKAYRAIEQFEVRNNAKSEVTAWLLTILRHTWVDRVRSAATGATDGAKATVDLEELPARLRLSENQPWETPEDLLNEFSDQQVINALHSLPEDIRWTLLLVNVNDMEHEEAAAVLGVPVGTIKSRAFRGRKMLREALLPLAREHRLVQD